MTTPTVFKSDAGRQALFDFYDSVLAQWPVDYEIRTVQTPFGSTHVIVSGDPARPPMILLHGASSNAATWAGDVATYAAHYRVYAVDLIGDAGKSAPTRPPYTGSAFADWLDAVRRGLGLDTVALVGLSLGGWVALKYAITYPAHVAALVLLAPGGITPHRDGFFLRMLPLFLLGKWGQRRAVQMLFADVPLPEGVVEGTTLIWRHFIPRRDKLPLFSDDELATLTMPVLMLIGEKDGLFDAAATAARLHQCIPQVQTHINPGVGHAIVQTAPRVVQFLLALQQPEGHTTA